jgi:hypothetical protein
MNMRTSFFVGLGLLFVGGVGCLVAHSNPVGLRCEFDGAIEFTIPMTSYREQLDWEVSMRTMNPKELYDALFIHTLVQQTNGMAYCKLTTNQWVWLFKDISVHITIKPNVNADGAVYFYNVFERPLYFSLSYEEYQKLRDYLGDKPSKKLFEENSFIGRLIELAPGQYIKYPARTGINLILSTD